MEINHIPRFHQIALSAVDSRKSGSVVALGFFDGVHVGHLALFDEARKQAAERNAVFSVFTFSDCGDGTYKAGAPRLTEWNERLELFRLAGVERVYAVDFSALSSLAPERFVSDVLLDGLDAVCAVCGFNFRFGQGASADADDLVHFMRGRGRDAVVLPPYVRDGVTVSSSAIRAAIEEGDVERANAMLGRPFAINFPVIHGKMLGRTIGVPTINQQFPVGFVLPKNGVYACTCQIDGQDYGAVSNVGRRPTVENAGAVNCESHILDFDGWLYGRRIRVGFLHYLREECRFDSLEILSRQIHRDIDKTRRLLQEGRSKG